jgi:hypothetical protein
MVLTLGSVSLSRVKSFSNTSITRNPRKSIVGDTVGTVDSVGKLAEPKTYSINCELTETQRQVIHDSYVATAQQLTDSAISLNDSVMIEKASSSIIVGRIVSDVIWNTTIDLVYVSGD